MSTRISRSMGTWDASCFVFYKSQSMWLSMISPALSLMKELRLLTHTGFVATSAGLQLEYWASRWKRWCWLCRRGYIFHLLGIFLNLSDSFFLCRNNLNCFLCSKATKSPWIRVAWLYWHLPNGKGRSSPAMLLGIGETSNLSKIINEKQVIHVSKSFRYLWQLFLAKFFNASWCVCSINCSIY